LDGSEERSAVVGTLRIERERREILRCAALPAARVAARRSSHRPARRLLCIAPEQPRPRRASRPRVPVELRLGTSRNTMRRCRYGDALPVASVITFTTITNRDHRSHPDTPARANPSPDVTLIDSFAQHGRRLTTLETGGHPRHQAKQAGSSACPVPIPQLRLTTVETEGHSAPPSHARR
jgi:hypothetical protein